MLSILWKNDDEWFGAIGIVLIRRNPIQRIIKFLVGELMKLVGEKLVLIYVETFILLNHNYFTKNL